MTVKELKQIIAELPDNVSVAYTSFEDDEDQIWLPIDGYEYSNEDNILILTYDGWD